jgi:hypothetical protein
MNSALILFRIEAGVRLGRNLCVVLVDSIVKKALIIPLGELFYTVTQSDANPDDQPLRELTRDFGGGLRKPVIETTD